MIDVKQILFPTDFSECATHSKQTAQELCDRFGADLHVLHVIHDIALEVPEFGMGLSFPGFVENIGARRSQMKNDALKSLDTEISQPWREKHAVTMSTRFGKPFLEIVRYARENHIDLIVIGSHGRTGLSHMLLGSVAEGVVREAPCPVMTVRQPAKESEQEHFPPGVHPLPVG